MPRTSNLRLNQEQEDRLVQYIAARYESLREDNRERIKIDHEAWNRYFFYVKDRDAAVGKIFPLSNVPLPAFGMCMEHFVSRCEDATVGDSPFFNFQPVGAFSEDKVQAYNAYFNWKLEQGKVHDALLESNLPVFIQGAAVLKATFANEVVSWMEYDQRVLHDRLTGKPIEILNLGPIIENEAEWMEMPDPIGFIEQIQPEIPGPLAGDQPPTAPSEAELPEAESPEHEAQEAPEFEAQEQAQQTEQPMMRRHLKADPSLVLDAAKHYWATPESGLKRTQTLYRGPKSEIVSYDRFLCPMDAASVDAADCCMELSDKSFDWFRSTWLERPWARWEEYASNFKVGDTTPKTGQMPQTTGVPTPPQRVENRAFDHQNPLRRVVEVWVRRDVLGDGSMPPQDIVVWMDLDLKKLVFYEYIAKVTPDFKRPYTVVSLCRQPNRWCGKSIWERGREIFHTIDRLFNGELYRTYQQANPPKGGDPTAAEEEPDEIGYDPVKYWKLKPGRKIDDLLQYAKVPDTNQRSHQMLEFVIFWLQLWLGVSNIAQGDYASVPNDSTKYGIQKTLMEASMLGRRWIRRKMNADEEHLTKLVKIAIATMPDNATETYEYTKGDQRLLATISGLEVRTLNINVSVIEQQHHEEQDINRCQAATQVMTQYSQMLDPRLRAAVLPLIHEILTDLGFKDVEKLLLPFEGVPVVPQMMGGEPGKNGLPAMASDNPGAPEPAPTPESAPAPEPQQSAEVVQ